MASRKTFFIGFAWVIFLVFVVSQMAAAQGLKKRWIPPPPPAYMVRGTKSPPAGSA